MLFYYWQKFGKEELKKEADEKYKKATGTTRDRQKSSKTPRATKTVEKTEIKVEKPAVTTRLTSAEGMRTFFKSVTPSTQLNGADSPHGFLNLDLPTHSDKVNEYLMSRFVMANDITGLIRPATLETGNTSRAYMNDQVPSERTVAMERFIGSPNFFEGPDVEVRFRVHFFLSLIQSNLSCLSSVVNC